MEGVMTNQITLAYTNWPRPWSPSLTLTMLTQSQMFIFIGWLQNKRTVPVRDGENDKTIVWPTAGSLSTRTVTLHITVSLFWPNVAAMGFMAFCGFVPPAIQLHGLRLFLHGPEKYSHPRTSTGPPDNITANSKVPTMGSHSSVKLLPYVTDFCLLWFKVHSASKHCITKFWLLPVYLATNGFWTHSTGKFQVIPIQWQNKNTEALLTLSVHIQIAFRYRWDRQ